MRVPKKPALATLYVLVLVTGTYHSLPKSQVISRSTLLLVLVLGPPALACAAMFLAAPPSLCSATSPEKEVQDVGGDGGNPTPHTSGERDGKEKGAVKEDDYVDTDEHTLIYEAALA